MRTVVSLNNVTPIARPAQIVSNLKQDVPPHILNPVAQIQGLQLYDTSAVRLDIVLLFNMIGC